MKRSTQTFRLSYILFALGAVLLGVTFGLPVYDYLIETPQPVPWAIVEKSLVSVSTVTIFIGLAIVGMRKKLLRSVVSISLAHVGYNLVLFGSTFISGKALGSKYFSNALIASSAAIAFSAALLATVVGLYWFFSVLEKRDSL